jgi:hypothetical protein
MNLWKEIKKFDGQTLKTLDRKKSFDILDVTDHAVLICPQETQTERPISRDEIENSYRHLVAIGQTTRTEIREKFSEYNPAYVVAILAELPNVEHSIRPIKLWIANRS